MDEQALLPRLISAAGHAEQPGCAVCSPGSLPCQGKVCISCRARITPLQIHLPRCAVKKSFMCLSEGRGHRLVDPVFGYPWLTVHRKKVYFHAKLSGPPFPAPTQARCYWRLKRGERTGMCFTKRMQRWGWVDCLMHSEIQIQRSKGKAVDQAAQQSPWK